MPNAITRNAKGLNPIAAHSLYGNPGTASAFPVAVAIGANMTLATAGTVSASGISALVATNGVGINNGTIFTNEIATALTGTAGGTLTLAALSGQSDLVLQMPASGGTVTLAAAPLFAKQRFLVDITQGATPGHLVLNAGFVTGSIPTPITLTPTAGAVDTFFGIAANDGTHVRFEGLNTGFSL
jgi:hypothetical protein